MTIPSYLPWTLAQSIRVVNPPGAGRYCAVNALSSATVDNTSRFAPAASVTSWGYGNVDVAHSSDVHHSYQSSGPWTLTQNPRGFPFIDGPRSYERNGSNSKPSKARG